jgi:putative solute:sodium symporter small subunit
MVAKTARTEPAAPARATGPADIAEAAQATMNRSDLQRAYWRRNLWLTLALLTLWFGTTFVAGFYAEALNQIEFLGFPLGFYIFAQGALIVYLVIIVVYVTVMNRMDRRFRVDGRR